MINKKNNPIHIGKKVKEILDELEISDIKLAKYLKITRQTANYYMNQKDLSTRTLRKIANVIGKDITIFFDSKEENKETVEEKEQLINELKQMLEECKKSMAIKDQMITDKEKSIIAMEKLIFFLEDRDKKSNENV